MKREIRVVRTAKVECGTKIRSMVCSLGGVHCIVGAIADSNGTMIWLLGFGSVGGHLCWVSNEQGWQYGW